jgi:hypothetical protein
MGQGGLDLDHALLAGQGIRAAALVAVADEADLLSGSSCRKA